MKPKYKEKYSQKISVFKDSLENLRTAGMFSESSEESLQSEKKNSIRDLKFGLMELLLPLVLTLIVVVGLVIFLTIWLRGGL